MEPQHLLIGTIGWYTVDRDGTKDDYYEGDEGESSSSIIVTTRRQTIWKPAADDGRPSILEGDPTNFKA